MRQFMALGVLLAFVPVFSGCANDGLAAEIAPDSRFDAETPMAPALPMDLDGIDAAEIRTVIPPRELPLPGPASEVVRMAHSGVGDQVLEAYIQQISEPFNLSSDDILQLHDLGLSDAVITALVEVGGALRNEAIDAAESLPSQPEARLQAPALPAAPATEMPPVLAAAPREVHMFYHELAPYGSWIELDGHGWAWQPSVAVIHAGWRPYYDRGRWVYSSDHGWYWHSYYTWGWAPFHYGRWHLHPGRGWVWFPDTVWGPAWVTWRVHEGYSGWAPLPPTAHFVVGRGLYHRGTSVGFSFSFGLHSHHYAFVPTRYFCDPFFHRHALRGPQVQNVFVNSTVINNIVVHNNRTIVNRGVDVRRVEREMAREAPRVHVRDWSRSPGESIRPERLGREQGGLVAYRRDITSERGQRESGWNHESSRQDARPTADSRDDGRSALAGRGRGAGSISSSSAIPSFNRTSPDTTRRDSRSPTAAAPEKTMEDRGAAITETRPAFRSRPSDAGSASTASSEVRPSVVPRSEGGAANGGQDSPSGQRLWARPSSDPASVPATVRQRPAAPSQERPLPVAEAAPAVTPNRPLGSNRPANAPANPATRDSIIQPRASTPQPVERSAAPVRPQNQQAEIFRPWAGQNPAGTRITAPESRLPVPAQSNRQEASKTVSDLAPVPAYQRPVQTAAPSSPPSFRPIPPQGQGNSGAAFDRSQISHPASTAANPAWRQATPQERMTAAPEVSRQPRVFQPAPSATPQRIPSFNTPAPVQARPQPYAAPPAQRRPQPQMQAPQPARALPGPSMPQSRPIPSISQPTRQQAPPARNYAGEAAGRIPGFGQGRSQGPGRER